MAKKAPDYYKYLTNEDKVELKKVDFDNVHPDDFTAMAEFMDNLANSPEDIDPDYFEEFFCEVDRTLDLTPVPPMVEFEPNFNDPDACKYWDSLTFLMFLLGIWWCVSYGFSITVVVVSLVAAMVPMYIKVSPLVDQANEINEARKRAYHGRKIARVFEACRLNQKREKKKKDWEESLEIVENEEKEEVQVLFEEKDLGSDN
jgi:hypothetical protein